jgi:hypothetical protein
METENQSDKMGKMKHPGNIIVKKIGVNMCRLLLTVSVKSFAVDD